MNVCKWCGWSIRMTADGWYHERTTLDPAARESLTLFKGCDLQPGHTAER